MWMMRRTSWHIKSWCKPCHWKPVVRRRNYWLCWAGPDFCWITNSRVGDLKGTLKGESWHSARQEWRVYNGHITGVFGIVTSLCCWKPSQRIKAQKRFIPCNFIKFLYILVTYEVSSHIALKSAPGKGRVVVGVMFVTNPHCEMCCDRFWLVTPRKFNIVPEKGWLEDCSPFEMAYFQGRLC